MPLTTEDRALIRGTVVERQQQASLHGWFPVTLDSDPAAVWWRFLGQRRLTAAFFQDSLSSQPGPERQVCRTPLAALDDLPTSVAPTAFIFHVSRCGSTLLTQMLASLARCIVMSEPPVLDAFFRLHHRSPDQSGGVHTFRQLVAALGQRRTEGERHFFVKFDCWHVPWIPFIREAFPQTPIVFLYRHPEQVLVSHRRQRGPQMIPGLLDTSRLKPDVADLPPADFEGYGIRMLEAVFQSALDVVQRTPLAADLMLVNYSQLPAAAWESLFPLFTLQCSAEELAAVQARSQFHSKHAGARFEGDQPQPAAKGSQDKKPDHLKEVVRLYALLDALRLERQAPSRVQPA